MIENKRESYCIICGEKKDGIEIREDYVIHAIRWFNRKVLRTPEKRNRIVVCSSCYPNYKTRRKKYLSRQRTYLVLGFLFMLFGVVIARNAQSFIIGVVVIIILYLLSLLSYLPDLGEKPKGEVKKRNKA